MASRTRDPPRTARPTPTTVASSRIADATYQLANFGDFATARSWQEHGEATWLMAAFMAAAALGRLPGGDDI